MRALEVPSATLLSAFQNNCREHSIVNQKRGTGVHRLMSRFRPRSEDINPEVENSGPGIFIPDQGFVSTKPVESSVTVTLYSTRWLKQKLCLDLYFVDLIFPPLRKSI